MYLPAQFDEQRVEVMHDLMRSHPLATLVTLGSTGLTANHIPLYLAPSPEPYGTLQGHVARANPLWHDISSAVEVLAVFHGPETYITPSWYATKKETGKVVPTWNYTVVHAYGTLRVRDDAAWLQTHLAMLTARHESNFAEPWKLTDAPPDFIEKLIQAVVGIELVITKLSGKWKVSQNQPVSNQMSVVHGLQERDAPHVSTMADLVLDAAKVSR